MRLRTIGSITIAVLAILGAVPAAAGSAPAPILVLPFDNVSGVERAPVTIGAMVSEGIIARGWPLVDTDVMPLLEEKRVRYLDSLDDDARTALAAATRAGAMLSGTIYTYADGRNAVVAVSARLVRADGTVAWGNVAALSSDDTESWFGFGRRETADAVAAAAVEELLREFPTPERESALVRGPRKPLLKSAATAYRAADLDPASPHLVCVLPFENDTLTPDASRVFADVLALRLAAVQGFEVVEPAKLRSAALKARVGSFRNAGPDELRKLAAAVGTSLFLSGTIYTWEDANSRSISGPVVTVEMTLVDVDAERVVWMAQHERRGVDYTGLLLLGAVSNPVALTDRVVSEMIDAQGLAAPRAAGQFSAARAARQKKTAATRSELRDPQKVEKEKP